jgi:molybdopterin/thiamine biosynthesis adenylyltransferase
MSERYARQERLVDVGEAGQARIAGTTCVVAGRGLDALVEARYLAGAGFGCVVVTDSEAARAAREINRDVEVSVIPVPTSADTSSGTAREDVASTLAALSPGAREVALGAYRALCALRAAILPVGTSHGVVS